MFTLSWTCEENLIKKTNFHISGEVRAEVVAINPTCVNNKQGSRVEDIKFSFMKVLTECKVYIERSFYK